MLAELLQKDGEKFYLAQARLEDREAIKRDLHKFRPKYVFNLAGVVRCFHSPRNEEIVLLNKLLMSFSDGKTKC